MYHRTTFLGDLLLFTREASLVLSPVRPNVYRCQGGPQMLEVDVEHLLTSPSKVHVQNKLRSNAEDAVGGIGGRSDADSGEAAAESAEAKVAGEETVTAAAETAGAAEPKAAAELKAAADNARLSAGSVSSEEATQGEGTSDIEQTSGEEADAVKAVAVDAVTVEAAVEAAVGAGEEKEKTFAEKIAPLAEKITEYILDHQDDAAQEERWRTTMKRDTDATWSSASASSARRAKSSSTRSARRPTSSAKRCRRSRRRCTRRWTRHSSLSRTSRSSSNRTREEKYGRVMSVAI